MWRAVVGVYVRRFLLGCVWSLAVVAASVVTRGVAGLSSAALTRILLPAAVFPAWLLVGAIHHVRYVRYRDQEPDPRDLSRRPRRDLELPGLDLARALAMVRELDRDTVLRVGEQADGCFVIRAARGGTWSRATAHVSVAPARGVAGADDAGDGQGEGEGGGGGEGQSEGTGEAVVERVGMRIEGRIPFMHATDDGRALFLVLQLRDHFVDELRAHLISSPASPREPETAGRRPPAAAVRRG
jgi:hypothetical protein